MEFRIADTFTDSLTALTGQEQKAVKTTAFDLQLDPSRPGLRFHKLDRMKDPRFCSVSVNRDIRLIVHKTESSLMLCFVGHHDDAYTWASRRKIERHPKTWAAQLVEIRERVEEIVVHRSIQDSRPALFDGVADDDLLEYGVPEEWLADVRSADEDALLELTDHLPQEAAQALLDLATGGRPEKPVKTPAGADPFDHPDAQRRFRILTDVEELTRALEYPWEKWTIFLHPDQRSLVEREYSGPVRVSGSAGTGKTIVALHRAVCMARRNPDATVLLTTFSTTLANALKIKIDRLAGDQSDLQSRIKIQAIRECGLELYQHAFGRANPASTQMIRALLAEAVEKMDERRFSESFLFDEWTEVVDARGLTDWDAYRDVPRLGRKTRIGGKQREQLWNIFEYVIAQIEKRGLITWAGVFHRIAGRIEKTGDRPFDFVVVDEAQDVGVPELRLISVLGKHSDSLFFAGDLGQRIFQQPFSWKAFGVDIRGRSFTLKINYRTSHQIRKQADRLLPSSMADVDGNIEKRNGTVSVFNGAEPVIRICEDSEAEISIVGAWLSELLKSGVHPHEIGVFIRDRSLIERALAAIRKAGAEALQLDESMVSTESCIAVGDMHLAKGLEFKAVAVMACDDDALPLEKRIRSVSDESDLEEVYNTERHLLYVACTRARDHLLVSGVDPASEFLDDMERNC